MRALVVHLSFHPFGGAEMYCARVADVLQRRFDEVVILHVGRAPSLKMIQTRCDVALHPDKVRFVGIPMPWPLNRLVRDAGVRAVLVVQAWMTRVARRLAPEFDLVVSTFAETAVQHPHMIQSVHVPMLTTNPEILSFCGVAAGGAGRRFARGLYQRFVLLLMGGGGRRRISEELTVTNSLWTRDQFLRVFPEANARALHSGVQVSLTPQSPQWVPFLEREDNFVIVGRVTRTKRVEDAIAIVERLRARGYRSGLYIIGDASDAHGREIATRAGERDWVHLVSGLSRADMESLIARQKWGIHCFHSEHYGLAPAELQALGCLTFIHDSGGQREIIRDARQRYRDIPDAVDKIDAVMGDPEAQREILLRAQESASHHTVEAFNRGLEEIIDEVMEK